MHTNQAELLCEKLKVSFDHDVHLQKSTKLLVLQKMYGRKLMMEFTILAFGFTKSWPLGSLKVFINKNSFHPQTGTNCDLYTVCMGQVCALDLVWYGLGCVLENS